MRSLRRVVLGVPINSTLRPQSSELHYCTLGAINKLLIHTYNVAQSKKAKTSKVHVPIPESSWSVVITSVLDKGSSLLT